MTRYIELNIEVSDAAQKDILIARLSTAGINGFEEEKNRLKAFITEDDYNEYRPDEIIEQNGLMFSKSIIEDRNWNAEWEADFKPVVIGKFCFIRASFHAADPAVEHDIIITPKMSFGTGHHATTHMMVQAMQGLDIAGKTVFDYGTGTGILSVLAEKCGAKKVTAIDNDAWSIENSIENINSNNCSKILISNSTQFPVNSSYDIILANINRNIILQNLGAIKQHLAPGGVVLLSGLLTGDETIIIEEATRHQLVLNQRREMNGWICLQVVSS